MSNQATIPTALNRYLSTPSAETTPSLATYLEQGAALVDAGTIGALRRLRAPLLGKLATLPQPSRLHTQVGMLLNYLDENESGDRPPSPALADVAFALLYFLKGFDRIPDSVPEIGLLDDALIIQTVLQRQEAVLRAHWLRTRRVWPESF